MQEESFRSRYFIKILSSIMIAVLNIVIQMLLPRALSVEEFGYYSYNLNIFTSVVSLANLSTSNALVAKFAKRNDEIGLIYFYLKFYLIEIIFLSISLTVLYPTDFAKNSFAGQTISMVILGLETSAVTKFLTDVISIYDSMAIAKISALFQIILKVIICIFTAILYFLGKFDLAIFYCGQVVFTFFIALMLLRIILKYQRKRYPVVKSESFKIYFKEYLIFCRPLIISSIVSQIIIILMNWCLMRFSGATEQAMFGAAWQLNSLLTFIFAPYAELSKREYSIISNNNNELKVFYESSLRRMFWLTAYFACFIGFCSDWILRIVYGDKYIGANIVTLFIMIYTIYQAWGQMAGAFMLATEKTRMNAILGIIGQIITIILVFIFQIPNIIWPAGLGAIGIALVYVWGNIINVCISVGVTARTLGMNVIKTLFIQIPPMVLCSIMAFILNIIMNNLFIENTMLFSLLKLFIAGVIYTIIIVLTIWMHQSFISMNKGQLKKLLLIKLNKK